MQRLGRSLDTGVSDGLGDGCQSGVVSNCLTETVGDVAYSEARFEVGPSYRSACAAVAKSLQWVTNRFAHTFVGQGQAERPLGE